MEVSLSRGSTAAEVASLIPESAESARVVDGGEGPVPDEVLEGLFRALKPLGKLVVENVSSRELGSSISTDLRIQGFEDIMCAKDPATGQRFVVGSKPSNLSVGASAAITLPPGSGSGSKWSMDMADSDLVDEQALLDDADIPVSETKLDCGTGAGGKKRACKNCSCGLAEREALENASGGADAAPIDPVAKASSCGGCYKGDAFRCSGCPFLGKPAFEPGQERLVLALDDDI